MNEPIRAAREINPLESPAARARRELQEAAIAYARACDERKYPSLNLLAGALKEAARRYRWVTELRLTHDPRSAKKGAAL